MAYASSRFTRKYPWTNSLHEYQSEPTNKLRYGWATSSSWSKHVYMKKPLPVIEWREDRLHINERAAGIINRIDVPIDVVAIAGSYRSGKSFLANWFTGLPQGGERFPIGHTVEPKTKGLWFYCRGHPHKPNTVLMVLDTEGLYDAFHKEEDRKIFILIALLCKSLIINMVTVIDKSVVDFLQYPFCNYCCVLLFL